MNSIEVNGVSRHFSDFSLNNLSFSVPQGSVMGFIGENGAGKTTTLKLLLNLIRRDAGNIQIFGMDNKKEESKIKEQVGVVFDECSFHNALTPEDISNIMGCLYPSWDKELYNNYLKRLDLKKGQKLKEFSRGMKMKLSIAAALSHRPRLLLLDEATGGLDPVTRYEILEIFFDFIQKEDHTIVMSTHITSDLEKIADYITFIHQGNILLSGCRDEILENHGILKCSVKEIETLNPEQIVGVRKNTFGAEALIADRAVFQSAHSSAVIDNATLEDIMLFYTRNNKQDKSA